MKTNTNLNIYFQNKTFAKESKWTRFSKPPPPFHRDPQHALEEDQKIAPQAQQAQHQNRYSCGNQ